MYIYINMCLSKLLNNLTPLSFLSVLLKEILLNNNIYKYIYKYIYNTYREAYV